MPPVAFAAVAGAIAAAGTAWATGLAVTFTVVATGAAISAGLAAAQMVLAPRQKPFRQEITDRGHSVRQPISPRQIVYGRVKTGGPIIYLQSTAGVSGTQPNKWLQMVIPLAAHEVDAIEDVYFDGEVLPLGPDGAVTGGKYFDAGWPIEAQRPRARVWKHLGQPGQVADARLVSVSGGKWTAQHIGTGIAYLYVELEYTASIYTNGIPNITAIVRGRKVHDPRTGMTAWTDNAALCIRDYLMLSHAAGGLGATADEFDGANVIAAANLCDEAIPLAEGGTERRYTLNGTVVLSSANTPRNTLESMLTACGGSVIYSGGKWRILPAAFRTPTVTLTDRDLRAGVSIQTRVSHKDVFTGVKGTYSSPANHWQPADYPAVQSDVFVAEVGGEPIWKDIDRPYTTSAAAAQRLAKIDILKVRQPITVTLPCQLTAFRVQAGDVVRVTLPRMGWNAKNFEVVEWLFAVGNDGTLGIDLSLRETDPAIFDFATSEEQAVDPAPGTSLPDWTNVGGPRNLSVDSSASQVIEGADGSLISRAVVTWDRALDGFVDRYEIQWRVSGETSWPNQQPVDGISSGDTFTFHISNMPVGASIDVRVRAVNGLGVPSNFVTVFGHVISGTTARPNPAITGLKVQGSPAGDPGRWDGDSATFTWNEAATLGSLFDAYVVTIRNTGAGGSVRRTAVVRGVSYTYTFADNAADGLVRSFVIEVQARTRLGGLSPAASLTATNPVPALPTAVTLTGEFRTIAMRYTPPADPDYSGILVWASETSGFTPAAGNLKYHGPDTLVVIPAEPGKAYFLRYASFDLFGTAGVTIGGEVSVSTVRISHGDLAAEIIDTSNLIPALTSRIDLIDTAGIGLIDRLADTVADVGALETAVSTETTARQTADLGLASRIDTVAAVVNSRAFSETFEGTADDFRANWHGVPAGVEISVQTGGETGGRFLRIGDNSGDDGCWTNSKANLPFDPARLYRISFKLRRTAGTAGCYLGVSAVAADGQTMVAPDGGGGSWGSHYFFGGAAPAATWTTYTAYFRGHANPPGGAGTVADPYTLHPDARYYRPMLWVNHPAAPGIYELDSIIVADAAADAAAAAVVSEAAARATADTAEATARETLSARVTAAEGVGAENAAAITSEGNVRAGADSALGSRVDTVAARFEGDTANLIGNPMFAADLSGWWFYGRGQRVAATAGGVPAGCPAPWCARTDIRDQTYGNYRPVTPGERHYVALMGASDPSSGHQLWFGLAFIDRDGNGLGVHAGSDAVTALPPGPTWRRVGGYVTVPANAAQALFYVVNDGPGGGAVLAPWYITQVQWRPAGMVDAAFAAVQQEASARATADTAEATAREILAARVTTAEGAGATNAAAITSEATARANGDTALGTRVDRVAASLDARLFVETFDTDLTGFLERWQPLTETSNVSIEIGGAAGGKFLRCGDNAGNDQRVFATRTLMPFDPDKLYKMTVRVRRPAGGGVVYLGVEPFQADGVTAADGTHWIVATAVNPAADWTVYTGFFRGYGVVKYPTSPADPSPLNPATRYFRPVIWFNQPDATGIMDCDYVAIEDAGADAAAAAVVTETTARVSADQSLGTRIDSVAARTETGFAAAVSWDFAAGTAPAVPINCTLEHLPEGAVRLTPLNGDPWIEFNGLAVDGRANPIVRARITRRGGSGWDGNLFFVTANHNHGPGTAGSVNPNLVVGQSAVIEWYMPAVPGTDWTTATITGIRLDFGNSAADVFDVDWIAIGNTGPGASVAVVQAETTARTTAITAEATARQTLQTTVDGHTSSIQTQATSIGGLESQYTVKVQAGTDYVAGYGLAVTAKDGTPTSSFVVAADRFAIAQAGTTTLNPTIPFIVTTKGGTPILSFDGYASISKLLTGTLDTETLRIGGSNVVLDGPTRQIRVNDGTTDLVKMGQISSGVYGIEIRDSSGALIMSSGAGLAAGSVKAANLAAGTGVNMVYNADMRVSGDGWYAGGNSSGAAGAFGWNLSADWTLIGGGTMWRNLYGYPPAGGNFFDITSNGGGGGRYPVIEGRRYEVSGYLGAHRCNAQAVCDFYDAAGTFIGQIGGNLITHQPAGGKYLSGYGRSVGFGTAPAGSVSAHIIMRGLPIDGGNDPHLFATRAYFGEAGTNQSEASSWAPGPTPLPVSGVSGLGALATRNDVDWNAHLVSKPNFGNFAYLSSIDSANISTYIQAAAIGQAYISEVNAASLRAGTIDALDITLRYGSVNVYDTNSNTIRMKMGHLPGYAYGFFCYDTAGSLTFEASGARNYMNGAIIGDLTVDRLAIKDNAINGVKIEDLSASNSAGATSANGATSLGVSLTVTGKPVTVIGSGYGAMSGGSLGVSGTITLISSGTTLSTANVGYVPEGTQGNVSGTWSHTFTPAAGARDFFVQSNFGGRLSIWVIENRK
jgi:Domain of unknown function (DUF1983)